MASLDWDVRCSSILNAWVTFGLVIYALLFENTLSPWRIFDNSYYGVLAMRICGGYFINDFIVVIICRNYYPGVSDYIIHHVVAISGFVLADVETGKNRRSMLHTVCSNRNIFRNNYRNNYRSYMVCQLSVVIRIIDSIC